MSFVYEPQRRPDVRGPSRAVRQLDSAIIAIIRRRWKQKQAGTKVPEDILERVLDQVGALSLPN